MGPCALAFSTEARHNLTTMSAAGVREGAFGRGEFAAVLRSLVTNLTDGRLEVRTGAARRSLWIDAAQVRAVVSDLEEEKLGRWLVARGVLDQGDMAVALLRQPEGMRFGAHLVQEGLIDVGRLQEELESLAVTIVARLVLPPGSYAFFPDERLSLDTATLEMTTASLLVAAVRKVDDVAGLDDLIEPLHYLRAGEDALLRFQHVSLNPHEAYLLSRIDGTRTAVQLRRVAPLPEDEFVRSLTALLVAGLVEATLQPVAKPTYYAPGGSAPERNGNGALQFTPREQREHEEVLRLARDIANRDLYQRLGLTPSATLDQIHERYLERARLYHPDRSREPHLRLLRRELAIIQTALREAYETLRNPQRRAGYDEQLRLKRERFGLDAEDNSGQVRAQLELARANVRRAQEAARAGDIGLAVQLLDQAVRFDPQPESLFLLARLEFKNPMWTQRGLDHLRQAVTIAPTFTDAWLELTRFWARRGRADRAAQCLDRILAYDPRNADALAEKAALTGRS